MKVFIFGFSKQSRGTICWMATGLHSKPCLLAFKKKRSRCIGVNTTSWSQISSSWPVAADLPEYLHLGQRTVVPETSLCSSIAFVDF